MLNLVWGDIDFDAGLVEVQPKANSAETWLWRVKDTDRRTLGLTPAVLSQLADLQASRPEGYPYVFVPPERYDQIQKRRAAGQWTYSDSRLKVINNFRPQFTAIRKRAGVADGRFHDLRSTALTNWFSMGLKEYEVMRLAGHSKFETAHRFYLAVADDLVDRARQASDAAVGQVLARAPDSARKRRRPANTSACWPTTYATRPKGLEPSTFGSTVRCSNQLSYGPVFNRKVTIAGPAPFCQRFSQLFRGISRRCRMPSLMPAIPRSVSSAIPWYAGPQGVPSPRKCLQI